LTHKKTNTVVGKENAGVDPQEVMEVPGPTDSKK
jgi:hypothetical protein